MDMDVKLPATTLFIIHLSDLLRAHWLIAILLVIGAIVGFRAAAKTEAGGYAIDWLVIRLPIVGNIIVKVNCARFARIHSSLQERRLGHQRTDHRVPDTGQCPLQRSPRSGYRRSSEGDGAFQDHRAVSGTVSHSGAADHPSGRGDRKTENVLQRLAEFYEEEVSQITKTCHQSSSRSSCSSSEVWSGLWRWRCSSRCTAFSKTSSSTLCNT